MQERSVRIEEYYTKESFEKIKAFADGQETPFVVIDNAIVRKRYDELIGFFPFAKVYYAVKANPDVRILALLRDAGSNFDIASVNELERVLSLGVSPERCSYGNTIKKR